MPTQKYRVFYTNKGSADKQLSFVCTSNNIDSCEKILAAQQVMKTDKTITKVIYELSDTEKRVLQSLHINGHMGHTGNMKLAKRRELLQNLLDRGMIDENAVPTKLGIEVSAPFYGR